MKRKLICLGVLTVVVLLLLTVSQGKIDAFTGPSSHRQVHTKVVPAEDDQYTLYLNKEQIAGSKEAVKALLGQNHGTLKQKELVCTVAKDDTNARKLAQKLQKNAKAAGLTLKIEPRDALMCISRAEDGRTQLFVVSSTTKTQYKTDTLRKKNFIMTVTTTDLKSGGQAS